MLGAESSATFYVIALSDDLPRLPGYIRLGKFNSKALIEWSELRLMAERPQESEQQIPFFLNAIDLSASLRQNLRSFSIYNLYPAPLLRQSFLYGPFWHASSSTGETIYLPAGMRYGVETPA